MSLLFLIGGARSGKSRLAVNLAAQQTAPVVFVATAEALDEEMEDRIRRHRQERPPTWTTVEEPLHLQQAIEGIDPSNCVVIDCLSLWTANIMEHTAPEEVERLAASAATSAARRPGTTIVVTNEVGLGIVPVTPLGRTYRDVLGRVNSLWAQSAAHAFFIVAGRPLALGDAASLRDLLP